MALKTLHIVANTREIYYYNVFQAQFIQATWTAGSAFMNSGGGRTRFTVTVDVECPSSPKLMTKLITLDHSPISFNSDTHYIIYYTGICSIHVALHIIIIYSNIITLSFAI